MLSCEKRATVSRSASASSPRAKSNPRQAFGIMRTSLANLPQRYGNPLSIRYRMFDIRIRMVSSRRDGAGTQGGTGKGHAAGCQAWIAAGFDALAANGVDAVRVEPLAKTLGITKGSFYWHFADRRALLDAMLDAWTEGRIAAIRDQASVRDRPAAVLRSLADLYTRHANVRGLSIELAIRALARSDEDAAKAVPQRRPRAATARRRPVRRARLAAQRGAGARGAVLQLSVRAEPARSEDRRAGRA